MIKRPPFNKIKSFDEFQQYYWYQKELSTICKQLNIQHIGTKTELNNNIQQYFDGTIVKVKKNHGTKKTNVIHTLSLDSRLLDCGFSLNRTFRDFFAKETKQQSFHFTANMATAWRKVKNDDNRSFTLRDMLNIYNGKSDYAHYDNSACEWNQFLKDFCSDKMSHQFFNKMKVASILWQFVKETKRPKKYTPHLLADNLELIKNHH